MAEGLLDDHPAPRLWLPRIGLRWFGQAGARKLFQYNGKRIRRNREIERVVTAGTAFGIEFLQRLREGAEGGIVVEGALNEADTFRQLIPHLLTERCARMLFHRVEDDLCEILVGIIAPGEPDQRETGRQQPPVREVVDGRHQFLT